MSDTDLDLELAGIDDGGNNKPPVHLDTTRNAWVYRASSISSCSRQLALIRTGVEPAPPPPDMLRRFRDGHLHERSILAEIQLQRPGWKVNPVDPYSGEQYEVEVWVKQPSDDGTIPGIVIVGHIDGLAVNPLHNPDSRICEAKAFSKDNFANATKAVEQGRFWDAYPYYRDQMTVYMSALEVPTFFAIKNKDNGEVFVFDVPEPPGDIAAIMARVRVVDARAGRGMVAETCDKRSFPCPTFRHCNHGDGATPSLDDDPAAFLASAFGEGGNADLDDLCDQYVTARDAEKKAGELKKGLQVKIAEVLGEAPSMDSGRFKVSWKTHTYRFLDEEAMRLDGVEVEEYRRERQSQYPDVREKKVAKGKKP
jgi:hypothetical protein